MSSHDDRSYLLKRAREERARADASHDTAVAMAHVAMAEEYERRAGDKPRPINEVALGTA
ncbi:hypothetical protein BH11PSE6_BH11PSE6_25870 [soil metagenome]